MHKKDNKLDFATVLTILTGALLTAYGGTWLKVGAMKIDASSVGSLIQSLLTNWQIMIGLVCYVIPIVLWVHLLRSHELSKIQPLLATVYIVTPIMAMLILGETVSPLRWLGVGVIFAGVVLVSFS